MGREEGQGGGGGGGGGGVKTNTKHIKHKAVIN